LEIEDNSQYYLGTGIDSQGNNIPEGGYLVLLGCPEDPISIYNCLTKKENPKKGFLVSKVDELKEKLSRFYNLKILSIIKLPHSFYSESRPIFFGKYSVTINRGKVQILNVLNQSEVCDFQLDSEKILSVDSSKNKTLYAINFRHEEKNFLIFFELKAKLNIFDFLIKPIKVLRHDRLKSKDDLLTLLHRDFDFEEGDVFPDSENTVNNLIIEIYNDIKNNVNKENYVDKVRLYGLFGRLIDLSEANEYELFYISAKNYLYLIQLAKLIYPEEKFTTPQEKYAQVLRLLDDLDKKVSDYYEKINLHIQKRLNLDNSLPRSSRPARFCSFQTIGYETGLLDVGSLIALRVVFEEGKIPSNLLSYIAKVLLHENFHLRLRDVNYPRTNFNELLTEYLVVRTLRLQNVVIEHDSLYTEGVRALSGLLDELENMLTLIDRDLMPLAEKSLMASALTGSFHAPPNSKNITIEKIGNLPTVEINGKNFILFGDLYKKVMPQELLNKLSKFTDEEYARIINLIEEDRERENDSFYDVIKLMLIQKLKRGFLKS